MDSNPSSGLTEKSSARGGLSNGPSFRRPPGARPVSSDHNHLPFQQVAITVFKDDKGYGMKVSGDNPVYVQSVKEGGAAERAGLHSGDKIIKVNGVNVTHSTHTEVVDLIKSAPQVVLTVQQRPHHHSHSHPRSPGTVTSPSMARSPLQHHHSAPTTTRDRITAPQPVDGEKRRQVEFERVHTLQLMLEKEQRFVESLRSELAKSNDVKKQEQLAGSERRVQTLQAQLLNLSSHYEHEPVSPTPVRLVDSDTPPPLPSRNLPLPPTPQSPPPLPPRQYLLTQSESMSRTSPNASPSGQVHTHHRTKSNPDTMSSHNLSVAEASKRLIASESMSELHFAKRAKGGVAWDVDSPRVTPPGTPPPPYGGSTSVIEENLDQSLDENDTTRGEPPPGEMPPNPGLSPQPPIISMEDDEMSDQEMSQLEDHGPFKSLSRLWNHHAHLAVFMNYVISNSEPSSLLFYLITDLYKVGNAKEMKKWAYEIHSSFLVPGAPLRLTNVDESIAREVDDVLLKEFDKEEILRRIFWKARARAKEDLNEQLADFQQKRTAGLGTLFGPPDTELDECIHDKTKEVKTVEKILLPKLEPFMEDIDRDVVDTRRFTTGAALGTAMGKWFGIRSQAFSSMLDRCPTFVSKDKGLKAKLLMGKTRKITRCEHHFVAHQYYTVTYCNHCQLIIWGIGPQGYQCSNCGLNIHRTCVKVLDENCPGPMTKKEKGISKLMERIMPENTRRKPSSLNLAHAERVRRQQEESENTDTESGERAVSGSRGQTARPDPVTEEKGGSALHSQSHDHEDTHQPHPEPSHNVTRSKPSATSINRSESYKERIHQKRQIVRERRKTSDPNLSKTNNDVDLETQTQTLSYHSGSSSNSSISTRSLDSPSNSLEAVSGGRGTTEAVTPHNGGAALWDSDTEADIDAPPDWKSTVPDEILKTLSENEIKRQEVINELFQTERSHVRCLRVLDRVFHRPMREQQILPQDQISLLFANIEEILEIHLRFYNSMKAKRKEGPVVSEIGDLLYSMFEGSEGEHFQEEAAIFCARQRIALAALRDKRRKDPNLNSFLTDAEGNKACRRLQLKDIIPCVMQRLLKYPLLLQNLDKYTESGTEESLRVQQAEERSKEISNFVDASVKVAEDQHRLAEIQRRLDKGLFDKTDHPLAQEFRNLDLTRHRLIYEGTLVWKIANRPRPIDLHVLLLEDVIILLQKQDDRYILKFYSSTLSPVIKMSTALIKENAVDKNSLYLVNTAQNGAQIYELVASSLSEKKTWFKHISDAAEAYKTREGRHRRQEDRSHDDSLSHDKTKDSEDAAGGGPDLLSPPRTNGAEECSSPASDTTTPLPSEDSTPQASPSSLHLHDTPDSISRKMGDGGLSPSPCRRVAEPLRQTTAESSLIEPSEVLVSSSPVLTAEPVLTPLEKLRRTDEVIKQALEEKKRLVADILHVPKDDFDNIAELAAEPSKDKEATEIVLAAVNQASKLCSVVNDALRVTEEEAVSASADVNRQRYPSVPAHQLHEISSQLNAQLSLLLNVMTARDEERERLRQELQRSREQIHAMYERQSTDTPYDPGTETPEVSTPSTVQNPTTPEVFVDAMSGEAETHLEAEAE